MTKKHFEWAAAYVRDLNRICNGEEREHIVRTLVDLFGEFNPRFDVARFRAACEGRDATDSAGRTVRDGVRA
jgi:hypothetical protein